MADEFSTRFREVFSILDGSDAIFREHWERPSIVRHKGALDLVTDTDLAIEAYLKDALRDIVPGAVFMAEESAAMAEPQGTCWIIDPVDGTTNLIHDYRVSAVSIALCENRQPVVGQMIDFVPKFAARFGIDACRRFVQQ